MRTMGGIGVAAVALVVAGCSSQGGEGASSSAQDLSGCHGKASSSVPSSGEYTLTSFGNSPSDDGQMSCGEYTKHGSWYYAASRQRYGCGARVQVEANGKCVVVETDDYGPDVCVEHAAGMAILDASPLVVEHLFGATSAGWSDGFHVLVTPVDAATALGPCVATPPPGGGGPGDDAGTPATDAGGGTPCATDGDCNPGNDGSGLVCAATTHVCIPGCHGDAQCPGSQTCAHVQPHWQCQ